MELNTISDSQSVSAFAHYTGLDSLRAALFLEAAGFNLEKASALYLQNKKFNEDSARLFPAQLDYPLWILEMPLFSFVTNVATDQRGIPLLVVNLQYWNRAWSLDNMDSLSALQWALNWVLERALEIPSVRQNGISILSNTANMSLADTPFNPASTIALPPILANSSPSDVLLLAGAPSLDDIHLMIVEFIVNVVPIKLKSLIVCTFAPKSWRERARSFLSPVPGLLKTFGVEMIECNNLEILTQVKEFNLPESTMPPAIGGKLKYDHAEWFRSQLPLIILSTTATSSSSDDIPAVVSKVVLSRTPSLPPAKAASFAVAREYTSIIDAYKDTIMVAMSESGKPIGGGSSDAVDHFARSARAEAINKAKHSFGLDPNGIELLAQIEVDLTVADTESVRAFRNAQYHALLIRLAHSKASWRRQIVVLQDLTTEQQLNDVVTNFLEKVKSEDVNANVDEQVWKEFVGAADTLVRKPLVEELKAVAAKRDIDKGKGKEIAA
ncbi:hypothetical protein HK100_003508 [Physocladia obscura]|uniref:Uncharacterized protein n=1 Tax=Physocladia obscura TaxID=109957 RepID=A0AAD5X9C2_9FUNG|nr:hypothetical protein HK100_003508 [Physocladia obscura]